MRADVPTVILAIVMACFLLGTVLTYSGNTNEFSASIDDDGSVAEITVHSSIQSDYSIYGVELRSKDARDLLVYYDESYASPAGHDKERSTFSDLASQLKYVNVGYRYIDADELKTILEDVSAAAKHSILVLSGALPSNVYKGLSLDLASTWMTAGGIIYWYSEFEFGYYSAPLESEFVDWDTNQPLKNNPFGLVFKKGTEYANQRSAVCNMLGISQNVCGNGSVTEAANVTNLGYVSTDHRCSIAFVSYGSGGVCIDGGESTGDVDWAGNTSFAKIISSRVCDWKSYDVDARSGNVRGTETFDFDSTKVDAVYVWLGTIYPRYAELFLC